MTASMPGQTGSEGCPPADRLTGTTAGDRGAGVYSMAFGLVVFLLAVTFVVHMILYMQLQTVAADAAVVGATKLAKAGATPGSSDEGHAQDQAQRMLGSMYDESWRGPADRQQPDDPGYVTFTVRTKPHRFAGWGLPGGEVVRSARVRIEQLR